MIKIPNKGDSREREERREKKQERREKDERPGLEAPFYFGCQLEHIGAQGATLEHGLGP